MKRKRKKKQDENVSYEIEVEDWEADYHFGLNTVRKGMIGGVYWESSKLILTGRILSPILEKASKARIEIASDPQMDDYWKEKPTIISAKAIGWMEIPRGDDTFIFYCSIPSQSFRYIALAAESGKIKFVSMFGTKLKWRQGTIITINLSKHRVQE
ncbi:MAG TPA: hypothetical protein VMT12_13115 [Syntrophales bacterium]|nr:hypothetical protein [Syntrophales bacterium]